MVVLNPSTFSAVLTDTTDSDAPQEVEDTLDFEDEYREESENEDKDSDDASPCGEPSGEFPLSKLEHKDASENFLSSSTSSKRSSVTSIGSADFYSGAGDNESESDNDNTHFTLMSRRPSLIADTHSQVPIILELGAGVIGYPDLSMSCLHKMTTPNPNSHCFHFRDSS